MPWQKVVLEKGISLEAPPAWKVAKRWARKDPEAVLSAYSQSIRVRLYGGKGSSYATIEEFLDSPEAKAGADKSVPTGKVKVSGKEAEGYRLEYQGEAGSPEVARSQKYRVVKEFCVLPAGKRFFVLSYTVTAGALLKKPELDEALWTRFLSSFQLSS